MGNLQNNVKEMVEIKVKVKEGDGARTFVVDKNADIRLVGSSIIIMEGPNIKLLVPAISVQSIIPVVVGNQISARDFKEGKPLADGQVMILSIGTHI